MLTSIHNNWWWLIVGVGVGISTLIIIIVTISRVWLLRKRNRNLIQRVKSIRFEGGFGHISVDKIDFDFPNFLRSTEPAEQPEWHKLLHEELKRLAIGKIVFNPPEVMKLGVKDRIETRISRDINTNLLAILRGRGIPKVEELKISELMKVRLSGCDFNIVPLNEEEQIIEETGFTEWVWDVTPQKSGKKVLHLHVTLRIRLPFGEERKDHPVLDKEIVVKVNPVYSVKIFIILYWKWIATALVLPLIGWICRTYIK